MAHTGVVRSLLAAVAVLVIAGCGSDNGGGGASAVGKAPIKIGFIGSVSGDGAYLGTGTRRGAQAAIKQVNADGGVDGRKLELVSADSQGDPTQAVAAARKFAADKSILAVIGPDFSSNVKAASPILEQAKLPYYIITSSVTPAPGSYMFAAYNGVDDTWGPVLQRLKMIGVTHIGVLATNDETGEVNDASVRKLAAPLGIKVDTQRFDATTSDVTAQVRKLKAAGANGFVTALTGRVFGVVMRDLNRNGLGDAPVVGGNGNTFGSVLADLLKGMAPKNLYFETWKPAIWKQLPHSDPQIPQLEALSKYAAPDITSAAGWDAIHLWANAIRALDKAKQDVTREGIKSEAEKATLVGAVATAHFTPQNHRGTSPADMVVVQWNNAKHNLEPISAAG